MVERCRASGIGVFGVTKGTCGMPQVARAMLRGGVTGIGESRFENIRRLRASGIDAPIMLLRSAPLSLIEEVVKTVDISLNSELATIRELSRVAERMARVHDIILMVDLGDLREGIWPSDLMPTVEQVTALPGVRIAGIGTNLTCFGAIIPTEINLGELAGHAEKIRSTFGLDLTYVSGGNSSSLPLLLAGRMPKGVNHLRIGEAILQGGRDTFHDEPWAELDRDIFLLSGELLEVKTKPSVPIGTMGVDAFGGRPQFEDKGERLRGIVNIGREDVAVEGLTPVAAGIEVLGASSDHLILDVAEAKPAPQLGDRIAFRMSYAAMLAAMTSEYVEKTPMFDRHDDSSGSRVSIFADQPMADRLRSQELEARLQALGYATALRGAPGNAAVQEALRQGDIPLMFGPDHRTTLAGLSAVAGHVDTMGLLWFDARAALEPPAAGHGGDRTRNRSPPRAGHRRDRTLPDAATLAGERRADRPARDQPARGAHYPRVAPQGLHHGGHRRARHSRGDPAVAADRIGRHARSLCQLQPGRDRRARHGVRLRRHDHPGDPPGDGSHRAGQRAPLPWHAGHGCDPSRPTDGAKPGRGLARVRALGTGKDDIVEPEPLARTGLSLPAPG